MESLGVGQQQLVEIVRALAQSSRILILDEPTAALAFHETQQLLAMLKGLRARGVSCVYISHRLSEVFEIADRITVLRDGASVGTWPRTALDTNAVVRHMVGRDIETLYAHKSAMRGEALLRVRQLSVADDKDRPRLHGINLTLHAGEVLGIGGLMGAGRTELLMHLYGAWGRRQAGEVALLGRPLIPATPRASLQAGMALVTEDRRRFGLHLNESIDFNLCLSSLADLSRWGWISLAAQAQRARAWVSRLGIRSRDPGAPVGRLSGGNQQKVVLAKALMTRPRVVLLDEPTRGVDIGAKAEIYAIIDDLRRQGCGILLVSSELPELIGLSDRIAMMCQGILSTEFDNTAQAVSEDALMMAAVSAVQTSAR
jgi:D-xylose transport system ATP-binding protein